MTKHTQCTSPSAPIFAAVAITLALGPSLQAIDLPPELPLWETTPPGEITRHDVEEQVRSHRAPPGSPSGSNRAFSSVSSPTYSIHSPENPNGVGLVICPGGGFRDVWLDREGHDLAIRLKDHGVTSLVLKYRTRPAELKGPNAWQDYQGAVRADGWQAVRTLRKQAKELGLQPDKIGISGFSAGGYLAISCALHPEPARPETAESGLPDFAGLFYPGIPEDAVPLIQNRTTPEASSPGICPFFIVNARIDKLTPVDKCIEFFTALLSAGVNAELHVFNKGGHGFGLGTGRGESTALWPASFVAWLEDIDLIED